MRSQSGLNSAFHDTDYCVDYEQETIVLHLGYSIPVELVRWVRCHGGDRPAWLITAYNPGGEVAPTTENHARESVLSQRLDRRELRCLRAVNRAIDGEWPDEPGWLVAGMEEGLARSLARRLNQAAIVSVGPRYADLVWTYTNLHEF